MKRQGLCASLAACAAVLALAATPALADPGGPWQDNGPDGHSGGQHGHSGQHGHGGQDGGPGSRGPAGPDISAQRVRLLASEHGLTGYPPLPPGVAKNLRRGKPLPPGIARRPVPPDMLHDLPVQPGREWRIVGSNLVQVVVNTGVVSAVFTGVFD